MGSEQSPHFCGGARKTYGMSDHRVRTRRGGGSVSHGTTASDVRLTLPARPENVSVIRHVLGAFAESLNLPADLVADMRLAVTEACTNVVRHAYRDGETGPIDVLIRPGPDRLELIVTDRGQGMGQSPDGEGPGLGIPLIAALSDTLDIQRTPSRGSRLAMSFNCLPHREAA
jgi:serine/threonine-protein kinase RsbW